MSISRVDTRTKFMEAGEEEFRQVLDALEGRVDADNVGAIHAALHEAPGSCSLDGADLDYLSCRGLDGLEHHVNASSSLSYLKEEMYPNFSFFENNYWEFQQQIEGSVLERDSRLMYGSETSLSKSDSCRIASFLVDMGLAEKVNSGLYRLTAEPEDYRMVGKLLEKVSED